MRSSDYSSRTPDFYLSRIEPTILNSLNSSQIEAFRNVLQEAIPKPSPKLVDLRFGVDLLVNRFYVVLFIGKDRRKKPRQYIPEGIARVGNAIMIAFFLLGANLAISAFIVLAAYLIKSALGIDLTPGHFPDRFR